MKFRIGIKQTVTAYGYVELDGPSAEAVVEALRQDFASGKRVWNLCQGDPGSGSAASITSLCDDAGDDFILTEIEITEERQPSTVRSAEDVAKDCERQFH